MSRDLVPPTIIPLKKKSILRKFLKVKTTLVQNSSYPAQVLLSPAQVRLVLVHRDLGVRPLLRASLWGILLLLSFFRPAFIALTPLCGRKPGHHLPRNGGFLGMDLIHLHVFTEFVLRVYPTPEHYGSYSSDTASQTSEVI